MPSAIVRTETLLAQRYDQSRHLEREIYAASLIGRKLSVETVA